MKKKNLITMLLIFFAMVIAIVPFSPAIAKALGITFIEKEDESFSYVDPNGYRYNVFPLDYETGNTDYPVSIQWAQDPKDTPANLTVPGSFTANVGGTTRNCVVYALSKNAFGYCDFETVSLPESIREMKEQSFIGCTELTEITIPHDVTEIKDSCFLDCSALISVKYSDGAGGYLAKNNMITSIGDHAFASCSSLPSIELPTTLTNIGRSAFQGCIKLIRILFPETALTIQTYAFANCASMNIAHIPTSVAQIEAYAFADCARLTLFFMAESRAALPGYETNFMKLRTASSDTTEIPAQFGFSSIVVDDYHPEFIFTVTEAIIRVNGCTGGTTMSHPSVLQTTQKYATIIAYAGTGAESSDFHVGMYDPETGHNLNTLVIPDRLKESPTATESYPVSIIGKKAFYSTDYIEKVVFNESLVKIEEYAFARCPNIETVDFENCIKLGEISQYAFREIESSTDSSKIKSLNLPASLKVIDGNAFRGLEKLESVSFRTSSDGNTDADKVSRPNQLFAIGRYAFYLTGTSADTKQSCHLILPNSLSDLKCSLLLKTYGLPSANTKEGFAPDLNIDSKNEAYSVAAHAFGYSEFIDTLEMEMCSCGGSGIGTTHTCNYISFGTLALRASKLRVFVSSPSLYRMYFRVFSDCKYLHSAFMYADKGYNPNRTTDYGGYNIRKTASFDNGAKSRQIAWKHGLFLRCDNVAVYVNYPQTEVDPAYDSRNVDKYVFYRDQETNGSLEGDGPNGSYFDQYDGADWSRSVYAALSRINVPVYYDVDIDELRARISDPIHYIKTGNGNTRQTTITNYIGTSSSVDLQSFATARANENYPVKTIGDCAFANNPYRTINTIANLPNTITKIGNYAFFSMSYIGGSFVGYTRITTDSATSVTSGGSTYSNYLILPTSLEEVGVRAFLNHQFEYIRVTSASSLTKIGAAAFGVTPRITTNYASGSKLKAFDWQGTNSTFVYENDTIYYQSSAGQYVLAGHNQIDIRNAKGKYTNTATYTVKSGTYAIAALALEGLVAQTCTLPSSLLNIYGYAFTCSMVEKIDGDLSNIQYIACKPVGTDSETFTSDDHFDNTVGKTTKRSTGRLQGYYAGAFRKCQKLTSMNIKSMTSLKGIGDETFLDCNTLLDMFGNNGGTSITYTYKKYNATSNTCSTIDTLSDSVVDLSGATGLRYIGYNAFKAVKKMKYFHTPVTTSGKNQESNMYVASKVIDGNSSPKALVGETAFQAYHGKAGLNSSSHYLADAWTGSTAYYQAEDASDIIEASAACESVNYWTLDLSDSSRRTFILMDGAPAARAYFANN